MFNAVELLCGQQAGQSTKLVALVEVKQQLVFPWQLANLGTAGTFFIYAVFAVIGLIIIVRLLPETRGKSLEELERILVPA